jgi:hypothetical protein
MEFETECTFCKESGIHAKAIWDASTEFGWAFLCKRHEYLSNGRIRTRLSH